MAKNQDLKATVNFGAVVDPSFGAAVSAIGGKLTDAAQDAAGKVNKLTKEQAKLTKEIKKSVLAGKDVGDLKRQYGELSDSIEKASRKLSRLNTIGKAGAMFGSAGRAGLAVARPVAGVAMLGTGLVGGVIGGAIAANAETALQLGKAQGYGLDFGTHMAYQGISKAIGLDEDSMGDLLDEMKNKVGEVGNEKMLDPLLAQIGLNKKDAQKMMRQDPNKLFKEVMGKLNDAVKSGKMSAAAAGSFADQLFGGEAQKIVSYMSTLGLSLEELEASARKYNLVTEEGAKQAVKGQYALNSLWGVISSGFSEIVSRSFGAASTDILKGADTLKNKLEAITPEITKTVSDWFAPGEGGKTGPERLWDTVSDIGEALVKLTKIIMAVADKLEWIIPDETQTTKNQQVILDYLAMGNPLAGAQSLAEEYDLEDWFKAQDFNNPETIRQLMTGYNERRAAKLTPLPEGALGVSTPETILPFTQRASGPVNSNNQINVTVVASPGQSPEEIGKSTVDEISKTLGLPSFNAPGANAFDTY